MGAEAAQGSTEPASCDEIRAELEAIHSLVVDINHEPLYAGEYGYGGVYAAVNATIARLERRAIVPREALHAWTTAHGMLTAICPQFKPAVEEVAADPMRWLSEVQSARRAFDISLRDGTRLSEVLTSKIAELDAFQERIDRAAATLTRNRTVAPYLMAHVVNILKPRHKVDVPPVLNEEAEANASAIRTILDMVGVAIGEAPDELRNPRENAIGMVHKLVGLRAKYAAAIKRHDERPFMPSVDIERYFRRLSESVYGDEVRRSRPLTVSNLTAVMSQADAQIARLRELTAGIPQVVGKLCKLTGVQSTDGGLEAIDMMIDRLSSAAPAAARLQHEAREVCRIIREHKLNPDDAEDISSNVEWAMDRMRERYEAISTGDQARGDREWVRIVAAAYCKAVGLPENTSVNAAIVGQVIRAQVKPQHELDKAMLKQIRDDRHAPDCESLCTEGADCNCGAEDPKAKPHAPPPASTTAELIAELTKAHRSIGNIEAYGLELRDACDEEFNTGNVVRDAVNTIARLREDLSKALNDQTDAALEELNLARNLITTSPEVQYVDGGARLSACVAQLLEHVAGLRRERDKHMRAESEAHHDAARMTGIVAHVARALGCKEDGAAISVALSGVLQARDGYAKWGDDVAKILDDAKVPMPPIGVTGITTNAQRVEYLTRMGSPQQQDRIEQLERLDRANAVTREAIDRINAMLSPLMAPGEDPAARAIAAVSTLKQTSESHGRYLHDLNDIWKRAREQGIEVPIGSGHKHAIEWLMASYRATHAELVAIQGVVAAPLKGAPYTREDMIAIARDCVSEAPEPYYTPEDTTWMPHQWVIDALMLACARTRAALAGPTPAAEAHAAARRDFGDGDGSVPGESAEMATIRLILDNNAVFPNLPLLVDRVGRAIGELLNLREEAGMVADAYRKAHSMPENYLVTARLLADTIQRTADVAARSKGEITELFNAYREANGLPPTAGVTASLLVAALHLGKSYGDECRAAHDLLTKLQISERHPSGACMSLVERITKLNEEQAMNYAHHMLDKLEVPRRRDKVVPAHPASVAEPTKQIGKGAPYTLEERIQLAADERDALVDRITTIADEKFGPFPVQDVHDSLTAIERGIYELNQAENRREGSARLAEQLGLIESARWNTESVTGALCAELQREGRVFREYETKAVAAREARQPSSARLWNPECVQEPLARALFGLDATLQLPFNGPQVERSHTFGSNSAIIGVTARPAVMPSERAMMLVDKAQKRGARVTWNEAPDEAKRLADVVITVDGKVVKDTNGYTLDPEPEQSVADGRAEESARAAHGGEDLQGDADPQVIRTRDR